LSKKNLNTTFLYALNPITIICTNIHGQFDVIPIFFLLLGIYLFNKHKEALSMSVLSFAIFTKTWPALFIIPLFKKLKNKLLFSLIVIVSLLSLLFHCWFFKTPIMNIIMPIKNYRGVYGYWGIGNILLILWPKIDGSILQLLRRVFFYCLIYLFFLSK
jgi:Gpi18-like mannosyltransferase